MMQQYIMIPITDLMQLIAILAVITLGFVFLTLESFHIEKQLKQRKSFIIDKKLEQEFAEEVQFRKRLKTGWE